MRTNGDDGERLLARFTGEERLTQDGEDDRQPRDTRTLAPRDARVDPRASAAPAKGAKSRMKKGSKSQAPRSASPPVDRPSKRPTNGKRAKSKSIPPKAPSAGAAGASREPALKSAASAPVSVPPSLDPRTTLRDHPVQKSAAASVRVATAPRRDDEISIPPTSTDPPAAGDLDDRFFAEGEAAAHAAHVEAMRATKLAAERFHADDHDARRVVVVVPPERRKKLANYVKVAVGFSAVLLLAAAGRVGVSRFVHPSEPTAAAALAAISHVEPKRVDLPPPVEVSAAPAVPAPDAVPAPVAVEEPAAVAAEPAPPARSAKQEKEDARRALERGKRKDAIDAAQRSVDLDPTDAEAWLILGSAQQDSGKWKEARESFVACTKQAKGGQVGECRMMLR